MKKTISVIIPTKNRPEDLRNLIDSLVIQSLSPDELIVIDQSETSLSKNLVESKYNELLDSKLVYILNPDIQGLVDAKRHGANIASSDLICFLDDDLILDTKFIEEIVRPFKNKEKILGSSGVFINFPERSRLYKLMYSIFHKGIFSDPRPVVYKKYEGYENKLIESNVLWGGITIWQSFVLKKVPFDDKNFLFMMEDFDFSAKVRQKMGSNFVINPNARAIHNHSETNRGSIAEQEAKKISEYIGYFKKRNTQFIDLIHLFWLLVGLLSHAFYESIKTREISILFSYFSGIYKGINFKIG